MIGIEVNPRHFSDEPEQFLALERAVRDRCGWVESSFTVEFNNQVIIILCQGPECHAGAGCSRVRGQRVWRFRGREEDFGGHHRDPTQHDAGQLQEDVVDNILC